MIAPAPDFSHLVRMTDQRGTFEHARLREPRPEHGYCTDDMARVLVVAVREPDASPAVRQLVALSLRFLSQAQGFDGDYRNRMTTSGRWTGKLTVDDCWGRSIWGLGTAAAATDLGWVRQVAVSQLERAAHRRSPWPRAMAYAAIGGSELLRVEPDNQLVRHLVIDAADAMADRAGDDGWPWPESRLHYANAVLPEAMIAAGEALDRPRMRRQGLELLAWLLEHETEGGHLSVTPSGGAGPGDARPAFDQQPIEVAALAEACARAAAVDADARWAGGVAAAVAWFTGENDGAHVMWDPDTGGGYDGLETGGVNRNEGAESTLALLATLQHARHLVYTPR